VNSVTEKRDAYDRARDLLATSDDGVLRYVALELRRCIEAIVYEKLWAYRDRIPPDAAWKWQPPQAFRALLTMEPDAAQTAVLRFAPEDTPGGEVTQPFTTLGTDVRPSPGWLNKTYNKLGSLLHADWPYAQNAKKNEPEEVRLFLAKVANDVEPFVTRTFTSTLAVTVRFECAVCLQPIIANVAGLEKAAEVTCLDPACGARYFCTKEGNEFGFRLDATDADCPECGSLIRLPNNKLAIGLTFPCKECGSEFQITSNSWSFERRKS
jgi:predicted RNA-binding Zn-ribbon protein involved in translation (DUF1610 family)